MMLDAPHDGNPRHTRDTPGDAATIARLQYLLADAIRTRETALNEISRLRVELAQLATVCRHWYVPDHNGAYCQACGLPEKNGHHVARLGTAS